MFLVQQDESHSSPSHSNLQRNLPNKRLIGKQDPYCELKLGDQTVRTKAIKRGNQHPEWEETLQFPLYETPEEVLTQIWRKGADNAPLLPGVRARRREPSTRFMTVGCYAEDFRKPDFIGETKVDITEALRKGKMAGPGSPPCYPLRHVPGP